LQSSCNLVHERGDLGKYRCDLAVARRDNTSDGFLWFRGSSRPIDISETNRRVRVLRAAVRKSVSRFKGFREAAMGKPLALEMRRLVAAYVD
jgi:hypothetical protein